MTPQDAILFSTAFAILALVGCAALLVVAGFAYMGFKALTLFVQVIGYLVTLEGQQRAAKPRPGRSDPSIAPEPAAWDDRDLLDGVRASRNGFVQPEIIEPENGRAYIGDERDAGSDEPPMREGGIYAGQA